MKRADHAFTAEFFGGALGDLLGLVAARHLGGDLADQLGGERYDLLLVKALRLQVAVDRLREDLYRSGLGFALGHGRANFEALTVPGHARSRRVASHEN